MPAYRHRAADYLHAALPQGLSVRRCDEPRHPVRDPGGEPAPAPAPGSDTGPWDLWPWSLHALAPAAQAAAWSGLPATVIWHFQLTEAQVRP
jgi:hypothetical protein